MTRTVLLVCLLAAPSAAQTAAIEMQGNVAFVKASIGNSGPLDMVLDSGTIRTTLDEAVATRLGFDLSMKAQSSGAKGMQQVSIIKDQAIHFCGLDVTEPLLLSYPLDFVSKRVGRHIDGILGVEFLRKYVVEVDYPARLVRAFQPAGWRYAGTGEALPVTYDRRLPIVTGVITPYDAKPIPVRLQVDTGGAGATVMLWKSFVEKNEMVKGAHGVTETAVTAFTGTTPQKQGRIQALQIGKVTIPDALVGLNDFQFGDPAIFDGNLGSGFLKQFKLIFDLPHDRLILEPAPPAPAAR